jgi:hypothetical protein
MKKLIIISVFLAIFSLSSKAQWHYTGLDSTDVFSLASKGGDTVFAGTGSGVYMSPNNGRTWNYMGLYDSAAIYTIAINGNHIFAGTWGSGLYISANNGATWASCKSLSSDDVYQMAVIGTNILAATFDDPYLSTNNGQTWNDIHNDLPFYSNISSFGVNGSNIWAGTSGSGIYYSSDQGQHWISKNANLVDTTYVGDTTKVDVFAMEGDSVYAATYGNGVFFSPDLGTHWSHVDSGITDLGVNAITVKGKYLVAGTNYQGVVLSENNGQLWRPVNNGLNGNTLIQALMFVGDTVFVGVDGGVYKDWISDEDLGIPEIRTGNKISVFPNPASSAINIVCSQDALIEISNIQGQPIETLQATGNKTTIGVSTLPSGVYIIKAVTKKGTDVEKFVKE